MSQPILYIDKSRVRKGQLEKLKIAMKELAAFIKANAPRVLSYAFYLDEEQSQMTVVSLHPDSASLELHMDVGAEEFKKFGSLIELSSMDVYGQVSDAVLERLHRKAKMLGSDSLAVHDFCAGFSR